MNVIGIITSSGKASVDVALYTLLPIMVVMRVIMRFLEVKGVVGALVRCSRQRRASLRDTAGDQVTVLSGHGVPTLAAKLRASLYRGAALWAVCRHER